MKLFPWLLLLSLTCVVQAQSELKTLRSGHPRLIWTAGQIAEVKQTVSADPEAREWQEKLTLAAGKMIPEPLVKYSLADKKLLTESRAVLNRVTTLAGLYLLAGDRRFADRARAELLNAAAFPDWNPANFLATAEMTNAVTLGYDWLYDELTSEERTILRQAIIEKGLKPGLKEYARTKSWPTVRHNWNAVCNGGLTVGALGIADSDPQIAGQILANVRKSLPKGMLDFAPDGGWPEGPGYWDYATSYLTFCFASLQSALGTDFDFPAAPGFSETGNYRIQMIGNSGQNFNFADAPNRPGAAPQMFWLARRFNRPDYGAAERSLADHAPSIFHLIWFNSKFSHSPAPVALPRSVKFEGIQVAILRSGKSGAATFVGIKGGDNHANHAHLDLGSFVLDHGGQRFAEELGPDHYTLPGYFGAQRWSYYRLRTEGQNTLTFDGENQDTRGTAKIVSFSGNAGKPFAVIDLTAGYPKATRIRRGVSLDEAGAVTLQDEITLSKPAEIVWHFHTTAAITLHGKSATLTKENVALTATILEPADAVFTVATPAIAPPQRAVGDTRKLMIKLPEKTAATRIVVRFRPDANPGGETPVIPLEKWSRP